MDLFEIYGYAAIFYFLLSAVVLTCFFFLCYNVNEIKKILRNSNKINEEITVFNGSVQQEKNNYDELNSIYKEFQSDVSNSSLTKERIAYFDSKLRSLGYSDENIKEFFS